MHYQVTAVLVAACWASFLHSVYAVPETKTKFDRSNGVAADASGDITTWLVPFVGTSLGKRSAATDLQDGVDLIWVDGKL
jgi:hypothetical protein